MSLWTIEGGRPLQGSLRLQGSKNAVLPILAACVVSKSVCTIENCPALSDVEVSVDILRHLGCTVEREGSSLTVDSRAPIKSTIPLALSERMRSSVLFLGALLGRKREAYGFLPGGCKLGERPVDYHLSAFEALGAEVEQENCELRCKAPGLHGAEIVFPGKSVGATENALLAAVTAEGKTVLRNAAREPEIVALCAFLRELGADIEGEGSDCIRIHGFTPRERLTYRIPGDRIVAASYLCFAAASRGEIELPDCPVEEIEPVLRALRQLGAELTTGEKSVRLDSRKGLSGSVHIRTAPYPLFPTDAAPLLMAVCAGAAGESSMEETVFTDRLRYVPALRDMGAEIQTEGNCAIIRAVARLHGAEVEGSDLRGSAALLCAALGAEGRTRLWDAGHLERGYESAELHLQALGADIVKNS